jgi:hypothetical protein
MDATKRTFAPGDARWRGIKADSIDIIERIKRQRKPQYAIKGGV